MLKILAFSVLFVAGCANLDQHMRECYILGHGLPSYERAGDAVKFSCHR